MQECAACGHTHPDNRPSQAKFVCQRCCGHIDHADHNDSEITKRRGVTMILSDAYREMGKKRTMRMAKKSHAVGDDLAERENESSRKSAETSGRRRSANATALGSGEQKTDSVRTAETPTTTRSV